MQRCPRKLIVSSEDDSTESDSVGLMTTDDESSCVISDDQVVLSKPNLSILDKRELKTNVFVAVKYNREECQGVTKEISDLVLWPN